MSANALMSFLVAKWVSGMKPAILIGPAAVVASCTALSMDCKLEVSASSLAHGFAPEEQG